MSRSEFHNEGLERWEKMREEWQNRGTPSNSDNKEKKINRRNKAKRIENVEEIIERLFNQSRGGELPEPLPLCQMIDILTDLWEADGMFD